MLNQHCGCRRLNSVVAPLAKQSVSDHDYIDSAKRKDRSTAPPHPSSLPQWGKKHSHTPKKPHLSFSCVIQSQRDQFGFTTSHSSETPPTAVPPAGEKMPECLPGGARRQLHHLGLHQHQVLPAQVLRRVHGRALLHPLQVQDGGGGVPLPQRRRLQLEDVVDPGLLLQPQLQEPQRHLRRPGELLRILRDHKLTPSFPLPLLGCN